MAPAANERRDSLAEQIGALLAPSPGRLEFAIRLALICALVTLVVEIYQTPEPALTAYVAFFVMKPDRTTSVVMGTVMLVLISLVIGLVLFLATQVIEEPIWRVSTMALLSFCLTFAASATKLKPVAGIVALITAYALDLLGSTPAGELATRALLYAWLFVGIPAGVCIIVNLVLGPAPRRLIEQALAHRLRLAAAVLRSPDSEARKAFQECLHEGLAEIPAWLKLAGVEKTSPPRDIAALQQASRATLVILSTIDALTDGDEASLPVATRQRIAETLGEMAAIFDKGGYPVDIDLACEEDESELSPFAAAAMAELRMALSVFAEPPAPDASAKPEAAPKSGFFLPDAFTNPAHVHYALKTTGAAMFCYFVYSQLDWSGIHTCLITCYIVALDSAAETVEKQTLRFAGCLVGAAAGIAAIVFLMPHITSIGGLMIVVFLAALASGWIAAGSPRISYVGFQVAFAFFLCVIQGSSPAFDMTVARDRTIGILFGNLVVAVVFTQLWPVTIAQRIDPMLAELMRHVSMLISAATSPRRWLRAVEARTKLAALEQNIGLTRYEPAYVRPGPEWIGERREIADILSSLQGPLLIAADQNLAGLDDASRRLDRLAERLAAHRGASLATNGHAEQDAEPAPEAESAQAPVAAIETPLARLEHLIARLSEQAAEDEEGTTAYAPA